MYHLMNKNKNQQTNFNSGEQKISILNFLQQMFYFAMNRKLRPTKSTYQIKEEQIRFCWKTEKNIEYKK